MSKLRPRIPTTPDDDGGIGVILAVFILFFLIVGIGTAVSELVRYLGG